MVSEWGHVKQARKFTAWLIPQSENGSMLGFKKGCPKKINFYSRCWFLKYFEPGYQLVTMLLSSQSAYTGNCTDDRRLRRQHKTVYYCFYNLCSPCIYRIVCMICVSNRLNTCDTMKELFSRRKFINCAPFCFEELRAKRWVCFMNHITLSIFIEHIVDRSHARSIVCYRIFDVVVFLLMFLCNRLFAELKVFCSTSRHVPYGVMYIELHRLTGNERWMTDNVTQTIWFTR
jgi:hypothetical protein